MHEAISKKNCIPVIIVSVIVSKNVHFPGLPKQQKQSCGKIKHSALTSFPCVSIITIYLTGKLELLTDPDEMLTLRCDGNQVFYSTCFKQNAFLEEELEDRYQAASFIKPTA